MVISKKKKKKRSSPKFGLLFLAVPHHHLSKFPDFAQIFHIAARKTMVLPKYFLLTARKILILPKSSKLGGAIAPPAPPAGTAMADHNIKNKFIAFLVTNRLHTMDLTGRKLTTLKKTLATIYKNFSLQSQFHLVS